LDNLVVDKVEVGEYEVKIPLMEKDYVGFITALTKHLKKHQLA